MRHAWRSATGVWTWFRKNWEPVLAILALCVSAWTAWATKQSIDLTNEGIRIATEAQKLAIADYSIRNRPNLAIRYDSLPDLISVENFGNGPAYIYYVRITGANGDFIEESYPESKLTIEDWRKILPYDYQQDENSIMSIIGDRNASIQYFMPVFLLGGAKRMPILSIFVENEEPNDSAELGFWWRDIDVSLCFISLADRKVSSVSMGEEKCPDPDPSLLEELYP